MKIRPIHFNYSQQRNFNHFHSRNVSLYHLSLSNAYFRYEGQLWQFVIKQFRTSRKGQCKMQPLIVRSSYCCWVMLHKSVCSKTPFGPNGNRRCHIFRKTKQVVRKICKKVKVPRHRLESPEGGRAKSSTLSWPRHFRRGWGLSAPRPGLFVAGKDPTPIVQEAGWAPEPVWTCAKNLAPTGLRPPGPSNA
jgi:hypothetical protein